MVIKRHVFKNADEELSGAHYTPDGPPNNPQAHLHWRFFDLHDGSGFGSLPVEDYAFCRRWRDHWRQDLGRSRCKLGHLGQHMFRGDLAESLRLQGRW